jgi:secreted trypsin-like serine protease
MLRTAVAWLTCSAAVLLWSLPASTGEAVTWRRAEVRAWERAQMERALGHPVERKQTSGVSPKIVGGTVADKSEWPFQVALLDSSISKNWNAQFCGGTLVDKYIVVTAGHCVYDAEPADIEILTGTSSLKRGGVRHEVAKIILHPQYNDNRIDYDIAIIKLKTPAEGLEVAQLLSKNDERSFAKPGTKSFVIGWGNLGTDVYPYDLREVTLPLVSTSVCNGINSYDGEVTSRMICAGLQRGGKDSCDGDSGGPLLIKDEDNKWTVVAGIVSWGDGCAEPNYYGVYSRVAMLSDWANSQIDLLRGHRRERVGMDLSCEGLGRRAREACLDRVSLVPQ